MSGQVQVLRPQPTLSDLLVEATIAGAELEFRRLLVFDLASLISLRCLKEQVLRELQRAGTPVQPPAEVIFRNYVIQDYEKVSTSSDAASCCTLAKAAAAAPSASALLAAARGRDSPRALVSAAPCPHTPLEPLPCEDGREALLAIAVRQFHDRCSQRGGVVMPLEARIKLGCEPGDPAAEPPRHAAAALDADSTAARRQSQDGAGWPPAAAYEITVRDFRGRPHRVRVTGGTSVQRLKQGVAESLGCSVVAHWRCMHGGRPLAEGLELSDYNIGPGAVVELQLSSQQGAAGTADGAGGGGSSSNGGGGGGGGGAGWGGGGGLLGGIAQKAAGGLGGGDKEPAQRVVQVLLPCGRLLRLSRSSAEGAAAFRARVLEAESAAAAATAGAEAAAADGGGGSRMAGAAVGGAAAAAAGVAASRRDGLRADAAAAKEGLQLLAVSGAGSAAHTHRHYGMAALQRKLLALLLAAAAVVMAVAVL